MFACPHVLQQVRNSLGHRNLLDREFHSKFCIMEAAVEALGGTDSAKQRLDELRHSALRAAPAAKGSWEQVLKAVADLDEAFILLTKEQYSLLEQVLAAYRLLVGAPAGCGKSLICIKLTVQHLREQEAALRVTASAGKPVLQCCL